MVRNMREAPRRSSFAKATRLLTNRTPVPQPTSAAAGVAPHMRGMGGEKTSAMAEGTACERRRRRELDEGMASGLRGDSRAQPNDRRDGYGQLLGSPPEVRAPAAPLRKNPLIRKCLVPAVNDVEHGCYGNSCSDDVKESPRVNENVHGILQHSLPLLSTVYRPRLIVCHLLQKKRKYRWWLVRLHMYRHAVSLVV